MKKKILSLVIAALLALAVLPLGALAAPASGEQLEKAPADASVRGRNSLYLWDFETDPAADGWQLIDSDGDGYNWEKSDLSYHSGANSLMSESHHSGTALTPDNWAITPAIELPEGEVLLKFWMRNANNSYPEKFTVYVGTTDDITAMEPVTEQITIASSSWHTMNVDLNAYAGQTVFIAFRHNGTTNIFKFYIDDVEVIEIPETLIFGSCFEQSPAANGWTYVDSDGDGAGWGWYNTAGFAFEGSRFLSSASTNRTPDNWAIVGPIQLRDLNNTLSFYARGLGSVTPDETFAVYIGASRDIESMTELIPEAVTNYAYTEYTADLDEYANEEVYFAVRHFNSDNKYYLAIDQFEVYGENYKYIESIELNDLTLPKFGEHPDYDVTLPDDAHYSIDYMFWMGWFPPNGMTAMDPDSIFDDEVFEYYLEVQFTVEEGYKFTDDTVVTINGETDLVEYAVNNGEDDDYFYVETIDFYVQREVLDTIEILDLDIPEWGAAPDMEVSVPDGAHYTAQVAYWCWINDSEEGILEEGEVFDDESKGYYAVINVIPDFAYTFSDETAVNINGGTELVDPDACWCGEDGSFFVETMDMYVEEPAPEFVWGDADGNGQLEASDSLLLMRYIIGAETVEEENLELCDVNGDGEIDLVDALLIMRKAMGTIDAFPVED